MGRRRIDTIIADFANRLSRRDKQIVQIIVDFFCLIGAAALAFQFRLGFQHEFHLNQMVMIVAAPIVAFPLFVRFGLYRAVLRYLPERAIFSIFKAVALATLLWTALAFFTGSYGGNGIPRSVPFLYGIFAFLAVGLTRFLAKALLLRSISREGRRRTLIYGAGREATNLAASMAQIGDADVLGFVDDNPNLYGRDMVGLRIYSPAQLEAAVTNLGIEEIILCTPAIAGQKRLKIASQLSKLPVTVRMLPSHLDGRGRGSSGETLERLDISELIGRSPVPPNRALIEKVLRGKRVLITGAGGSIGSQLARLVDANGPAALYLVDNSEYALYRTAKSLTNARLTYPMQAMLGSVTEESFMRRVFAKERFDVVFHAAAYKHVDMVEQNVREGIRNNVFGVEIVADLAYRSGVRKFVLISSDKAVNPVSVMGASKRVGELVVRKYAELADAEKRDQHFVTVRFGNVIGSSGSVVPLFAEQIEQGGPVTVTDRNATRYFMAASEAIELIVQSAALSRGGETFLLDMGDPLPIYELARDMIALAGKQVRDENNPGGDIEIETIGLRAGEKLNEELWYSAASTVKTEHPKIMMAKQKTVAHLRADAILSELHSAIETLDEGDLRELILRLTADYNRDNSGARVIPLQAGTKAGTG